MMMMVDISLRCFVVLSHSQRGLGGEIFMQEHKGQDRALLMTAALSCRFTRLTAVSLLTLASKSLYFNVSALQRLTISYTLNTTWQNPCMKGNLS